MRFIRPGQDEKNLKRCVLREQQLLGVYPEKEKNGLKKHPVQCSVMGQFFTRTQPKVGSM